MPNPIYTKTETCPDCWGYGGRWEKEECHKVWDRCEKCGGTGEIPAPGQTTLKKVKQ